MTNLTLNEVQKVVDEWINSIGITYYSELTNTAILTEEVGEVARLMARFIESKVLSEKRMKLMRH